MTSKEAGSIGLHTDMAASADLPIVVAGKLELMKVCAKCGLKYIWAGKVKRVGKYGVIHFYLQVTHSKKLRRPRPHTGPKGRKSWIRTKRLNCYIRLKE